ncbi:hypothetical protein SDC9_102105 [bioreactor metagenome]|uniref:Uncharacterized protein n=1 Tax=bioreactor metagenome TaxID=1076179 RepID=A0A645ASL9_9ZZZZ
MRQRKARLELAADLLLKRMGKLNAIVVLQALGIERLVVERIVRQAMDQHRLGFVEEIVDAVVQPRQQNSAGTQDTIALAPDRLNLANVAVGHGMHDHVERFVRKRQRLRHIRANNLNVVALARGDHSLGLKLALGIVQHRTARACRRKQRHLLAAAAGQAQHVEPLEIRKPVRGHGNRRRQHNAPVALLCREILLMGDGSAPFPVVFDPAVDRL